VDLKKLSLALSGGAGAAPAAPEPAAAPAPANGSAVVPPAAGNGSAPANASAAAPHVLDALEMARGSSGSLLPSNASGLALANDSLPSNTTLEARRRAPRAHRRRRAGAAAGEEEGLEEGAAAAAEHPPTAAALLPPGAASASLKALLPAAKFLGDNAPLINSAAPLLGNAGSLLSTAAKAAPLFKAAAPLLGATAPSANPAPASVAGGALTPAAAARVEALLPEVLVTAEAQPAMPPGAALDAALPPEAASPPYKALFEVPEKACVVVTEALSGPLAKYLLPSTVPAAARTICGGEGETLYDALLGNFDASACGENSLSNSAGGATTATANVNVVGCNRTRVARPDITLSKLKFVRVVNHTWTVDALVSPLASRASASVGNSTGDGSLALPAGGTGSAKFTVAVTKNPDPAVANRIRVSRRRGAGAGAAGDGAGHGAWAPP
jgi:hypothetical protein